MGGVHTMPRLGTGEISTLAVIGLLILINAAIQIVKAMQTHSFAWDRVGTWAVDYLRYVGAGLLAALTAAAAKKYGPAWVGDVSTPGFYALAVSVAGKWLVGRLLRNLGVLATPAPAAPAKVGG